MTAASRRARHDAVSTFASRMACDPLPRVRALGCVQAPKPIGRRRKVTYDVSEAEDSSCCKQRARGLRPYPVARRSMPAPSEALFAELSLIELTARRHTARLNASRFITPKLLCIGNTSPFRAGIFLSDWVR